MLESLPDHGEPDQRWEREYQLHVFQWAARQVRNEFREGTWQAFWRTVVEDQAIERVAQDLKITSGAVYIARSRVTARLRQVIAGIEG
jgi:RNA polymerase sigma-70 factor (ECF subfamily)